MGYAARYDTLRGFSALVQLTLGLPCFPTVWAVFFVFAPFYREIIEGSALALALALCLVLALALGLILLSSLILPGHSLPPYKL
jgi:hypothetical protein